VRAKRSTTVLAGVEDTESLEQSEINNIDHSPSWSGRLFTESLEQ